MAEDAENPEGPKPGGAAQEYAKPRSAYEQLPFDLTNDELAQSGTQKMLLGDLVRLKAEVGELKVTEKSNRDAREKLAVLRSKFKQYTFLEIIFQLCLAVAFAVIGWVASTDTWTKKESICFWVAIAMIVVAVFAKWKGVYDED